MSRKRFFLSILIITITAVLFLPLYTSLYLYPAFTRHLLADAEQASKRLAYHIMYHIEEPGNKLEYEDITDSVKNEIAEMLVDFHCEKVKIFAPNGEILYSTNPADIGTVNHHDYFRPVVTRGTVFSKIVKKNNKTAEGRVVSVDVVETYVPLKFNNRIIGAGEVYFDITDHWKNIHVLIWHSSVIVILITGTLLIVLLVTLSRLNRNMIAREKAEKELAQHLDQLEGVVHDRTSELRKANIQLQEDIIKRQLAEKALQESEEKYRGLIETASDAIFVIDAATARIVDVNRKGSELLGRPAVEIVGLHFSQLHPPDETERYRDLLQKTGSHITPPDIAYHVLHKDGYRIPVEISTSIMELGDGKIIQGIFRDIRERLLLEEEIQKAKRLESAGILAGGIAHDFNNLLTAILGNISLAKTYVDTTGKVYKRLMETEKAIMRAKDLTRQLLTFARGGTAITRTVNLANTIVESAEFVLRGSNTKCEFNIDENLWPVKADLSQINQVIHNLIINARQSMPDGGICRVEAKNVRLGKAESLPLPVGRYLMISISDKGSGIAPEHLNKIFDPFFTTKRSGTGLGLSMAYSVIKRHGGLLTVDSVVGSGSTFNIYLPASKQNVLPAAEHIDQAEFIKGEGMILLMDDEEFVLNIASDILFHLGYGVETAKDGKEALDLYKKRLANGKGYAAVILDLTVPGGMGGKETVRELKKLDPDAKVIVSSGYATDPILAMYKEYGFDAMVPKPYKLEDLAATLHQVLG